MGRSHRFHQKNTTMGVLSEDARTFTKRSNKACLSAFRIQGSSGYISLRLIHAQASFRLPLAAYCGRAKTHSQLVINRACRGSSSKEKHKMPSDMCPV